MPGNDTKPSKENSKLKRLHVIQVQGHRAAVVVGLVDRGFVKKDDGGKSGRAESYNSV